MSEMGQTATFLRLRDMPALPPKADVLFTITLLLVTRGLLAIASHSAAP